MKNEILIKLANKEISTKEAYQSLYPKVVQHRRRRAHFVKLRITIPDEVGVTRFLRFLFFFPTPIFLGRMFLRFVKDNDGDNLPITKSELFQMLTTKGILLNVTAKSGEKIYIKTL